MNLSGGGKPMADHPRLPMQEEFLRFLLGLCRESISFSPTDPGVTSCNAPIYLLSNSGQVLDAPSDSRPKLILSTVENYLFVPDSSFTETENLINM